MCSLCAAYLVAAALRKEKHSQQAAANTNRSFRDTAAPTNYWVEFSSSEGGLFPSLGLFGHAGASILLQLWGTVWAGVAKLLPEENLSRGLWVKGNILPCP